MAQQSLPNSKEVNTVRNPGSTSLPSDPQPRDGVTRPAENFPDGSPCSMAASPVHEAGSTSLSKRLKFSAESSALANLEDRLLQQRRAELRHNGEHLSLLFCGEVGCGKTSLLNSLFGQRVSQAPLSAPTSSLIEAKTTIEVGELKIRLTTIDTPGYGDSFHIAESFERVTDYIVQSFRNAIELEKRPDRPGIDVLDENVGVDAVLFFIAPHRLKELDVIFMRRLHSLATIVPIISKADVYTHDELRAFRESVRHRLRDEGIDLPCDPFAVICAQYPRNGTDETAGAKGRVYPWGTALSECDEYSDLPELRRFLLTDGLVDLHKRRRAFYEKFRAHLSIYKTKANDNVTSKLVQFGKFSARLATRVAVIVIAAYMIRNTVDGRVEAKKAEHSDEKEEKRTWEGLIRIFRH